jgi:hypothetical protein
MHTVLAPVTIIVWFLKEEVGVGRGVNWDFRNVKSILRGGTSRGIKLKIRLFWVFRGDMYVPFLIYKLPPSSGEYSRLRHVRLTPPHGVN